jgi:hypothetical protein
LPANFAIQANLEHGHFERIDRARICDSESGVIGAFDL